MRSTTKRRLRMCEMASKGGRSPSANALPTSYPDWWHPAIDVKTVFAEPKRVIEQYIDRVKARNVEYQPGLHALSDQWQTHFKPAAELQAFLDEQASQTKARIDEMLAHPAMADRRAAFEQTRASCATARTEGHIGVQSPASRPQELRPCATEVVPSQGSGSSEPLQGTGLPLSSPACPQPLFAALSAQFRRIGVALVAFLRGSA